MKQTQSSTDITSGYPTKEEAEHLLAEAVALNPGQWGNHSRTSAHCARAIAMKCPGMDPEKAYTLALLHDIGRSFGSRHLGHVIDGYSYMLSLGYPVVARICLTHSFQNLSLDDYIGKRDVSEQELKLIEDTLHSVSLDDYDRLIQLCDALAGPEGVLDIRERMNEIKQRYGFYPQKKWDSNLALKDYFEQKVGENIYVLTDKANYRP